MKKLLAIVLAAACAVSMAACVAKTGGIITRRGHRWPTGSWLRRRR